MTPHLSEEDLILLYYDEPGAAGHAAQHLAECPACRMASVSLSSALTACDEWSAPEPSPGFGHDVWTRLAPALSGQPRPGHFFLARRWLTTMIAATAFAILLVVVFFAGRLSQTPRPPVLTGLSDRARERILAIAVADHLERAQTLLTEFANTGFADRERAEDLVQEGRLMRQSLAAQRESATTGFLDEVDGVLLEVAHIPDTASAQRVRDLRKQIQSESLVFKAQVVESNLRNKEQKL